MLEIVDYSSRRGVIVSLLPQIYALFSENAKQDVMAGLEPPENIILWKQSMRKALVDVQKHWLFVLDGEHIAGLMFYRMGAGAETGCVFIEELQMAWRCRQKEAVLALLLDKFLLDRGVNACGEVLSGARIKNDANKELLASVGFGEIYPGGYQTLGAPKSAVAALKLRYQR